jgi:TetR/AcrR family transcriptional repressor of nem operon
MARTRNFDKALIAKKLMKVFIERGYEGASVSDLVATSGLLRGSLYAAYGSKLGIFVTGLQQLPPVNDLTDDELNFVIIGLLEVAPNNPVVKTFFQEYLNKVDKDALAQKIGQQVLSKAD